MKKQLMYFILAASALVPVAAEARDFGHFGHGGGFGLLLVFVLLAVAVTAIINSGSRGDRRD
jgi:hypothetical protein